MTDSGFRNYLIKEVPLGDSIIAYRVAAFTDYVGEGSPTGVVLDADGLSDAQMQQIADAMACSHTAFVTELAQTDVDVHVRFFTPAGEIKNCAHGTIAAHVVRSRRLARTGTYTVRQQVASSVQPVEIERQGEAITVSFRQDPIRFSAVKPETVAELLSILGLSQSALDERYSVVLASPGVNRFLVPLRDVETLYAVKPQQAALRDLSVRVSGIGCFVYTLTSDAPLTATARMFAPVIGVDEDNVNGNSSGCLGAYLLSLDDRLHELTLGVHQGHAFKRPGTVLVKARRVGGQIETVIGGTAVIESNVLLPS